MALLILTCKKKNSNVVGRAWINTLVKRAGEKCIQQDSCVERHCILERKQTDLEDEPEERPE